MITSVQAALSKSRKYYIAAGFFVLIWWLFYSMLSEGYPGDWDAHVRFALDPNQPQPPNFMLHAIIRGFGGSYLLLSFYAALAKTASMLLITELYFREFSPKIINSILAILICFAMPIMFLAVDQRPYLGKFSPNLLHNPTYILMVPFMLGLWYYVSRYSASFITLKGRWIYLLPLLSLLTALAKPSFHLGLIPAVGIYCLINVIKHPKRIWALSWIGISICLPVLIQMLVMPLTGLYPENETGYIVAPFAALALHVHDPAGTLFSSLAFPLIAIVLLTLIRVEMRYFFMALVVLLCALIVAIIFAEAPPRLGHANFYWGIFGAVLLVFVEATRLVLRALQLQRSRLQNIAIVLCMLSLGLHAMYGIRYHMNMAYGAHPFLVQDYFLPLERPLEAPSAAIPK